MPSEAEVPLEPVVTRYRVIAWVTGVTLLVMALVAMPMKYLGEDDSLIGVVAPAHGFLYVVYVLATLDLMLKRSWRPVRTLLVLLAGAVPFASFYTERKVVEAERAAAAGRPASPV